MCLKVLSSKLFIMFFLFPGVPSDHDTWRATNGPDLLHSLLIFKNMRRKNLLKVPHPLGGRAHALFIEYGGLQSPRTKKTMIPGAEETKL